MDCHLSPVVALCEVPLSLAYILAAARHQREGGKFAGVDYKEADIVKYKFREL